MIVKRIFIFSLLSFFILSFPYSRINAQSDSEDSLLQIINQTNKPARKISCLNELSENLLQTTPRKSLEYSNRAIKLAKNEDDASLLYIASISKAKALMQINRVPEAKSVLLKVIDAPEKKKNNNIKYLAFKNLGKAYHKLSVYDSSNNYYFKSIDLVEKKDETELALIYNQIGLNYASKNKFEKALEYYSNALSIFENQNNELKKTLTYNYLGSLYWQKGNYKKSKHYYQEAIKIQTDHNDKQGLIKTYNNLGIVHKNTGHHEKAINYHQKAKELIDQGKDPGKAGQVINYIGNVYFKISQFDKALQYYKKSLELRNKTSNILAISESVNNIASVYRSLGKYDSAMVYLNKSLELREKIGNKNLIAYTLNNKGNLYWKTKEYDKALGAYLNSLEIRQSINDQEGIASTYNNIGTLYQNINNYEKALQYYKKSLNIKEKIGNQKEIAYTLHIIGNSYLHLKKYDKALEYYQNSLLIRKKIGDNYYIAQSLHNIGLVHSNLENYDKALKYLQESLRLRKLLGDYSGICASLNSIGNVHYNEKKYTKAINYFQKAIENGKKHQNDFYISLCSRKLGEIYITRGNYNKGISYLNYSLDKGHETNNKVLIKNALYELYKYFRKANSNKKALDYYIKYSMVKDSIEARNRNMKVVETLMNYELSKKQNEIDKFENQVNQLSLEKELRKVKIKKQKNFQYFLFVILFLIVILAFVIYKRYEFKKKTNVLLQEKYDVIKKTNQKLIESEKKLKEANATKDKFFSIIAHDLRNPFNALYGLTDHISQKIEKLSKNDLEQYFSLIHQSATKLLSLVENLLTWSRTQRGKIEYNPGKIDLKDVIQKEIEIQKLQASEKNIDIKGKYKHNSLGWADDKMIITVLRNLISNAIKFTHHEGEITIKTEEQNDFILINVIDNGTGISKENQTKLFRIDENYTKSGTQKEEGTGLGLILCKEFVEKNGGKIYVKSEPNKGSCFTFTIPKYNS